MSNGLNELDLLNLDPKTERPPKPSRLADAKSAHAIYSTLRRADERSATNRARVQALFDGVSPYDRNLLVSTGQSQRTNLNFGEASRYLSIAVAGYVDLINAVETLVNVSTTEGELQDRMYADTVLGEELTRVIRDWPEFHSSYLRLVTESIIHGVGVSLFNDDFDFRFRVTGWANFYIPRQTPASEHSVEVACFRDELMLHELYSKIEDERIATERGWNPAAVRKVIMKNASTDRPMNSFTEWEQLQAEIKNNDIYTGIRSNTVPLVHTYVREFDGTVSHYIHCETDPTEFLFKSVSRFPNPEQAFILFSNGVGTNGTYHSVRGLGQQIFAHCHVSNRLRSQATDAAMLASTVILQPQSQRALDELQWTFYGGYTVLSPNIELVERAVPNLSNSVVPIINDVSSQMERNLEFYSNTQSAAGSPYRSSVQVQAELEAATRLTTSNLNLFYSSWRRLLREMVRRIINGPKSDPAVADFFKRCAERGVDETVIMSIDINKTAAVRAIGAGNASARSAALMDLSAVAPELSERGRKNLIFDRVASRVGYEAARRYADPVDAEPVSTDAKLAKLENALMRMGTPTDINDNDLHGEHFTIHAAEIQEILAGLEAGQIDGQSILPVLQAFHEHTAMHVQVLSGDPMAQSLAAAARELIANSEAVLMNLMRQQQKIAREQTGGDDPKLREQELRIQEISQRIELKRVEAETRERREEQKFQQQLALADVKARNELMAKSGTLTGF